MCVGSDPGHAGSVSIAYLYLSCLLPPIVLHSDSTFL